MIKAIETRYKGYRFRSRLEARWAVFFDALHVRWEYEPEGFDLGETGWYLPDFRITLSYPPYYPFFPEQQLQQYWVEIKPNSVMPSSPEWRKARALADASHPVLLIYGAPGDHKGILFCNDIGDGSSGSSEWDVHVYAFGAGYLEVSYDTLKDCVLCDGDWKELRWATNWNSIDPQVAINRIQSTEYAANIARAARFEHGE